MPVLLRCDAAGCTREAVCPGIDGLRRLRHPEGWWVIGGGALQHGEYGRSLVACCQAHVREAQGARAEPVRQAEIAKCEI